MALPRAAEHARKYIELLGTSAIPCGRNKKPLTKWSQRNGRAESPDDVVRLFRGRPADVQYALLLGTYGGNASGVLVFDTDSEQADTDHGAWAEQHDVEPTFTVRTPRGGFHYYYRAPEGIEPKGAAKHSYADIKASGGYVLGPEQEGREVVADVEPVQLTQEQYAALYELVDAPAQQQEQATDPTDVAPTPEAADEALLAIPNDDRFADRHAWVGMALRHKAAGGTLDAWLEWCWGDVDENARVWESATGNSRAGGYSVLCSMAANLGDRPELVVQEIFEVEPAPQQEADERHRDFWTGTELLENPELLQRAPRVTPTGMGHLGELTLLAGLPKQGKSRFTAWEAAVCTREGKRVLWVSFEESLPRIVSRFRECGTDFANLGVALYPKSLARIRELAAAFKADVIYLDSGSSYVAHTLGKVPDNSEYSKWYGIYSDVQRLAIEDERAIIMLVHSPKGAPGEVIGSIGAAAAADSVVKMTGSTTSRVRKLEFTGRWDNEVRRYESNHDTSPTHYTEKQGPQVHSLAARVFYHVSNHPGCTTSAVRNEVGGRPASVIEELQAQAKQGYLTVEDGPSNAKYWTAVPGFQICDDGLRIEPVAEWQTVEPEVEA